MKRQKAFTIVELLVVVGIIALLISLLIPTLVRSRQYAASVACRANLKQIGDMMQIYANNHKGWLYPVWNFDPVQREYITLGTNWPPNHRWPVYFTKYTHPDPDAAPYSGWVGTYDPPLSWAPGTYVPNGPYDPVTYDPAPWTPKWLICPANQDAYEAHSYILNKHLAQSPEQLVKAQTHVSGRNSGDIIVAGEKVTVERDYYMEVKYDPNTGAVDSKEFASKVELFRHGPRLGSNYLYKDWSVKSVPPEEAAGAVDPWGLPPGP